MASSAKKRKRPEGKGIGPRPFKRGIPPRRGIFLKGHLHLGNHVSLAQIPAPYCFSPFLSIFIQVWPLGGRGRKAECPGAVKAVSSSVVLFVPRVGRGDTLLNLLCGRSVGGRAWVSREFPGPQTILRSPEGPSYS